MRSLHSVGIGLIIISFVGVLISPTSNFASGHVSRECALQLGPWADAAPAPDYHLEGASAVVNGRVYLFTGFNSFTDTLYPTQLVDVYNAMDDFWESVTQPRAKVPLAMSHVWAAVDGQYVWLAGGFVGPHPGVPTDEVWRYDTVSDTWWPGPDLPQARASGGVVIEGRTLHYMGGLSFDRQLVFADHWTLDLDNPVEWQAAAPMMRARNHFQAVHVNGLIYAVAGQIGHDVYNYDIPWLDVYDPVTDTWEARANMPQARSHFETGTFAYKDRILAVGGKSRPEYPVVARFVTEYNTQTDTWTQLGSLPLDLVGPVAAMIDDRLIITSGGTDYNEFQANTWRSEVVDPCASEDS